MLLSCVSGSPSSCCFPLSSSSCFSFAAPICFQPASLGWWLLRLSFCLRVHVWLCLLLGTERGRLRCPRRRGRGRHGRAMKRGGGRCGDAGGRGRNGPRDERCQLMHDFFTYIILIRPVHAVPHTVSHHFGGVIVHQTTDQKVNVVVLQAISSQLCSLLLGDAHRRMFHVPCISFESTYTCTRQIFF